MADDIVKVIADTRTDAATLQQVVNGDADTQITSRLGESYPSVQKAIKLMTQSGVGFTSFETKSLMTASSLANGSYAIVTNDTTTNNGLHLKKSGSWSKVSYDVDERQKAYADNAKSDAISAAATDATNKADAALISSKDYYSGRALWYKIYQNTVIEYNTVTRTLSWSGNLLLNIEKSRRVGRQSVTIPAGSVVIPDKRYRVVYIDLDAIPPNPTPIVFEDIVKVGGYNDTLDTNYGALPSQLPIFRIDNGLSFAVSGFFEGQVIGATKPYYIPTMETQINSAVSSSNSNATQLASLQQQVDEIDSSGGGGGDVTYPTFIDEGVLKKSTSDGLQTLLNPAPDTFVGSSHQNAKNTITTLSRDSIATTTPVAIGGEDSFVGSAMALPSDPNVMLVIPSFGQSNSVGAQGYAPDVNLTTNPYADTLLMPSGVGAMDIRMNLPSGSESAGSEVVLDGSDITGFQPLIAKQSTVVDNQGATPLESMGLVFADAVYKGIGIKPKICMFAAGWGGRFQYQLAKSTIPYQNFMTALTRIKEIAAQQGMTVYVPFVAIIHGESDSSRAQYLDGIKTWQTDFNTDVKAITGQLGDVPFLCSQASTFRSSDTNGVLAPYNAAKTGNTHYVAAPYYPYALANDNLHLGKSAPYIGEKLAHAAARIYGLFGSQKYGALQPTSVTYDDDKRIDIDFNVPVAPLTHDTWDEVVNSPAPNDWGFVVRDGTGAAVPIASIDIIGSSVRIITSSTIVSGSLRAVEYALNGFATTKVTGQQPRGQLRDAEKLESVVDGKLLRNWCVHFRELF